MTNMRVHTMAAIRDARGLNSSEKAMLYTIESRGEVFSTAEMLRDDCGMGKNKFYEVRGELVSRELVAATVRRPRGTTRYRVNHQAVAALAPMREAPMSPPVETIRTRDANVTPGSDDNVAPIERPMSPSVVTQREPWKGSPEGDPVREPVRSTPEGFARGRGNLLRVTSPIYVRLVRTGEMTTPEKHLIGEMSPSERADWHARIDVEADLP